MTKQQKQLRQLIEKAATTYEFRSYETKEEIARDIQTSYEQFYYYFCKTDEDKEIAKQLYSLIAKIHKNETLDLSSYSTKTLLRMAQLMCKENDNGSCTYDCGVFWYGYQYYEDALKLMNDIKKAEEEAAYKKLTPQQRLVEDIKSGKLLDMLKKDFKDIETLDKDTYLGYIEYEYKNYSGLVFARMSPYVLEFVGTGYLDPISIVNAQVRHIKINDHVGFRLRNYRKDNILKIETYADIKQVLNRVNK